MESAPEPPAGSEPEMHLPAASPPNRTSGFRECSGYALPGTSRHSHGAPEHSQRPV